MRRALCLCELGRPEAAIESLKQALAITPHMDHVYVEVLRLRARMNEGIDALGRTTTCRNSILCLVPQGRHVQAVLLEGEHADPRLPMGAVIGRELEILGTHGMAAHRFPRMLDMITGGRLAPERLIGRRIPLEEAPAALAGLAEKRDTGVTVIDCGARL